MRRFLLFLTVVVICLGTFFFYQHRVKQNAANTEQMFEIVMAEKMRELTMIKRRIGASLYNSTCMMIA